MALFSEDLSYRFEALKVIEEAFDLCALNLEELTETHLRGAIRSLDFLMAQISASDQGAWSYHDGSSLLTAGEDYVLLEHQAQDVISARVRDTNNITIPVAVYGKQKWADITDKTLTSSRPTAVHFPRGFDTTVVDADGAFNPNTVRKLKVWPIPTGSDYTLEYHYVLPFFRILYLSDRIGVRLLWQRYILYGLAKEVALKWAPSRHTLLNAEYTEAKKVARMESAENAPVEFTLPRKGMSGFPRGKF